MWDINTKPHSSKKLGVDPFLVQKWTKNCKKTADFQVAKKICLTVNFLFYCKNQLFQTLSIAWFFKSQAFCHWGVRQPKNFRVRPPLFSNNEKKNLPKSTDVGFELTPTFASKECILRFTNWATKIMNIERKYLAKNQTFVFSGFWEAWLVLFWDFFRG